MKRFLNAALVTTVTCGLSLITASCSDDKEPSEEEKQQQAEQQAETDLDQAAVDDIAQNKCHQEACDGIF